MLDLVEGEKDIRVAAPSPRTYSPTVLQAVGMGVDWLRGLGHCFRMFWTHFWGHGARFGPLKILTWPLGNSLRGSICRSLIVASVLGPPVVGRSGFGYRLFCLAFDAVACSVLPGAQACIHPRSLPIDANLCSLEPFVDACCHPWSACMPLQHGTFWGGGAGVRTYLPPPPPCPAQTNSNPGMFQRNTGARVKDFT